MTNLTASKARENLYRLLDEVSSSHHPVQISSKRGSAVLIGGEDWRGIQETLYLLSTPGMRESIRREMRTPISKCDKELKW